MSRNKPTSKPLCAPSSKERLDHILVSRGLVESGEKARALVYAGKVRVDDVVCSKPGTRVSCQAGIEVAAEPDFVSRGGNKLRHAFERFNLNVAGVVCVDVGASTGGFTDCLLKNGAVRVYAVDVGKGQLHWRLRNDDRVVVMEGINARYIEKSAFPEKPCFATIDVSFISLKKILPAVKNILAEKADIVTLVKPQFEAGRDQVARGGVVRDPAVRRGVVDDMVHFCVRELGFECLNECESPVHGPAGNIEHLVHWKKQ